MNYVLVRLDKDFEHYHNTDTGMNTGIFIAPFGMNQASHLAITGVVVRLPERLNYEGYRMKRYKEEYDRKEDKQRLVADMRGRSMAYDVPVEVPVGYRVLFEYSTRLNAEKEGRYIQYEGEKYCLMPYDHLVFAFRPETNYNDVKINDVYPLNGFLLIKPLEYEKDKSKNGHMPVGVKTEADLFLPTPDDAKFVKRGNVWYANVLSSGCLVNDYADFPKSGQDSEWTGRVGDKVAYDGRHQKRLERPEHRVIFKSHTLYRIHRKDIIGWFKDGDITGKQINK